MRIYQDSVAQDTTSALLRQFEVGKLYEPEPVRFSFETVGWPILGGLLVLGLLVAAFFWYRSYARNRYRREALRHLEGIKADQAVEVFVVLKRTAIHAFGREKVSPLSGSEWLKFLEATGKNVRLLAQDVHIQSAIYRSQPMPAEAYSLVLSNAKQWVRTHAVKL
ncbi:DUF4381 domain-containing protein [Algoriphagus sp. H41]|uniref:DUF4381 domain-containing protein n=1 Tax=Algoriphagus oliviformis TaxID=2811231 RepID=A0ABS3C7Y2_9BACT|nr:DUF4381 domain-containing protein [Algoriphagus oliviformis]MBN7813229.1 DUF4381 domain-containing protein [Algoriphagus oliviformis]